MDKSGLLTIKEFSNLTNVHIKSLRYYDAIGVLKPAYVDPDTGYRYYSLWQRELIFAIQMCIEADIPLKRFVHSGLATQSQINYSELLDECVVILEDRLCPCALV